MFSNTVIAVKILTFNKTYGARQRQHYIVVGVTL